MEKKKDIEISLLKGIGIIAVVVGHTSNIHIVPIIYYWHLPLFFFIIGLTYNHKKYEKNVSGLMGARLHGFFPMYFVYMILLGLLHNVFYNMGILADGNVAYNLQGFLDAFWNYFRLYTEPFAGPLWFMFPWFFATLLYGVIVYGTSWMRIDYKKRQIFIVGATVVLAAFGFFCVSRGYLRYDYTDVALVIMPIVAVGGLYRLWHEQAQKFIVLPGCLVAFGIMLFVHLKYGLWTILDQRRYNHVAVFYLLAFCGIYCCLYVAKLLKKKPEAKGVTVLAKIGEYSMDIMTLHFVFFKLVDYIWFKCFNVDEQFALNTFPHSFKTEWSNIVYSIVGIIGPILVRMTLDFGKKQVIKVYLRKEVKES